MTATHTMEDDFQHFLSYSSLSGEPADVIGKLRKAFEANWSAQPAPIQSAELAELRSLAEAATPGEWVQPNKKVPYVKSLGVDSYLLHTMPIGEDAKDFHPDTRARWLKDAAFIAAANPAAILRLLDALATVPATPAQPIADVSAPTDERAAFETEFKQSGYPMSELRKAGNGLYIEASARIGWQFWKARAATPVSDPSDGYVLAPHYRGYANLGTGQYLLNNSRSGEVATLIISVATDEEKAGRVVGDERANPTHAMLQPEAMAVRIDFTTVAGLDALESQLRKLRAEHFSAAPVSGQVASIDTPEFRQLTFTYATKIMGGSVPESSAAWAALVTYVDSHSGQAAQEQSAIQAQPFGYISKAEAAKLADNRLAGLGMMISKKPAEHRMAIYLAPPSPPAPTAQPLTDAAIGKLWKDLGGDNYPAATRFARAIERHLAGNAGAEGA